VTRAPETDRPEIAPLAPGTPRPRWSVMVPTYNCAEYLRRTLASVLEQDPGPDAMQIEVVDDASGDRPEAVVAEVGQGRIEFLRQPENVGPAANLNTCLRRARGEIVHLLHGDDWVRPGFYETMGRPFASARVGAAFCRYVAADETGRRQELSHLEQATPGVLEGWLERIAAGQRLQTPSIVVRRAVYEQLGGFDPGLDGYGEDWEMWVRIAARHSVWYEPEPLAVYRVRSSSLTGRLLRTGENVRKLRRAVEINAAALPPHRVDAITRVAHRSIARAALRRGGRLLGAGNAAGMRAQLREAWRTHPSAEIAGRATFVVALGLLRLARSAVEAATRS
jgi:glycosyltransferase involved in cell wall biosynthesis